MSSELKPPADRDALDVITRKLQVLDGASALPTAARITANHGTFSDTVELAIGDLRGPLGYCFENSLRAARMLAGSDEDWMYCEGFAYQPRFDMLFPHAWLVDNSGIVLETTWHERGATYHGVPLALDVVSTAQAEEPGGVLHHDWLRGMREHRAHEACCGPSRSPGSAAP